MKAILVEPVARCFWYVYHKQDLLKDKLIEEYPEEFFILSLDFGDSSFNVALVKYNNEGYEVMFTHGCKDYSGTKLIDTLINKFLDKKHPGDNLDYYDYFVIVLQGF